MSQWTHVAGCIRVDAIRAVGYLPSPAACREAIMGPCGMDLPRGSEGTLEITAIEREWSLLSAYTVAVAGDLRDFGEEDCKTVGEWFTAVCTEPRGAVSVGKPLMIRQAILVADVERGPKFVWLALRQKDGIYIVESIHPWIPEDDP